MEETLKRGKVEWRGAVTADLSPPPLFSRVLTSECRGCPQKMMVEPELYATETLQWGIIQR